MKYKLEWVCKSCKAHVITKKQCDNLDLESLIKETKIHDCPGFLQKIAGKKKCVLEFVGFYEFK